MSSRFESAASRRRNNFKKGLDSTDGRRRRDDTLVKLRKDKKEESMLKRRAMTAAPVSEAEASATSSSSTSQTQQSSTNAQYTVADIPKLMQSLTQPGASHQQILESVRGFRKLLSVEDHPPVDEIMECGVMPLLVQLLSIHGDNQEICEMIQFEAAWALTNVASTEQTKAVVDHGAIPPLVQMLMSGNADVREQSIWCLGNVAGDCPRLRDIVLESGALPALLQNITQPASPSLLGNTVWSLSNCCRGKPQVALHFVQPAIPVLAKLLSDSSISKNIIADACWALSYLSDGDDDRIQAVMESGVTSSLVALLQGDESRIITPCLRALGNFVSGNDAQTQNVIDCGILPVMKNLLTHAKKSVRKEANWLLSNIAAGTQSQINQILEYPAEIRAVVDSAQDAEWEVRKEALWVLSNMCTGGTKDHVQMLVQHDVIAALCSVLTLSDSKITMVAMEAIERILKVGESLGSVGESYLRYLDEAGGFDKLEELQEHVNEEVYEKALSIIDTYLGGDEVEAENLLPQTDGNQFVFGPTVTNTQGKTLDGATTNDMNPAAPLQQFNFQF